MISQADIVTVALLREKRNALERQISAIEKQENPLKERLKTRLESGEKVEPGKYLVALKQGRKYPSWKTEFLSRCGEAAVLDVEAKTKPTIQLDIAIDALWVARGEKAVQEELSKALKRKRKVS